MGKQTPSRRAGFRGSLQTSLWRVMEHRPFRPSLYSEFWLWESVLNPTASGKPISGLTARRAFLPILQMHCRNFGPRRKELGLASRDPCSCQGGCDGAVIRPCTAFLAVTLGQPGLPQLLWSSATRAFASVFAFAANARELTGGRLLLVLPFLESGRCRAVPAP